ncbi:MAG: energy-coupling factor transporter transmembrane component T [Candidatus Thermoplasmatota archaeon]
MRLVYQKKNTLLHDINPLIIVSWFIGVLVSVLLIENIFYLSVIFAAMMIYAIIGKIANEWCVMVRYGIWLAPFILIINLFANQSGDTVLLYVKGIPIISDLRITLESFLFSISMILRLLCIISSFVLLSLLVNPDIISDLLLKLRVPRGVVLSMSITMRFIPIILKDAYILKESIRSRGYRLESKGFIKRIKNHSILFMPLLSSAMDRSIQIAESMEARGFNSKRRTIYNNIHLKPVNIPFIISPLLFITILLYLRISKNPDLLLFNQGFVVLYHGSWVTATSIILFFIMFPMLSYPARRMIFIDTV